MTHTKHESARYKRAGQRLMVWMAAVMIAVTLVTVGSARATPLDTVRATGVDLGTATASTSVQATTIDSAGNVYATGAFSNTSLTLGNDTSNSPVVLTGGPAFFVVKYNAAGQVVWASKYTYSYTGANVPAPVGIAVDGSGNAYVLGGMTTGTGAVTVTVPTATPTTLTLSGFYNPYLIKLNSTGGFAWASSWGAANAGVQPFAVAVNAAGTDIYMAGMAYNADIPGILVRTGNQNGFVMRIDSTGTFVASKMFGGAGAAAQMSALAVDASGNVYAAGDFYVAGLTVPQALTLSGSRNALVVKYDSSFTQQWLQNMGSGGSSNLVPAAIAADAANVYFSGELSASITLNGLSANTKIGTTDALIAKLSAADGSSVWATNAGGTGATLNTLYGFAVDSAGVVYASGALNQSTTTPSLTKIGTKDAFALRLSSAGAIVAAGNFGGTGATASIARSSGVSSGGTFVIAGTKTAAFTTPSLAQSGTVDGMILRTYVGSTVTVTKAGAGGGTVTSNAGGLNCGSTCTSDGIANGTSVALTATADGTSTFSGWSGTCSGSASVYTFTISADTSCTATFAVAQNNSGGNTPAPTPAVTPPPSFVTIPPAASENAATVGSGTGSVSFAANYANPSALTFTAAPAAGGSLPSWISFDPNSVTFSYNVPLPSDLPIQPLADTRVDARANWSNTVYPLSLRVGQIPIMLVATDRSTGVAYASTIQMSFYAPRSPVAISAVSMSLDRVYGDRSSARSALSYDGGQMVFETAATNLFPAASSTYGDIVRYHALSGSRDRLSQTAIPGGGVANAANGISSSPAVSANGAYAAFASDAASVSNTPAGGRRQVYRTSLAYPRIPLNQSATPAPDMVSATAAGIAGDGASDNPSLSQDGRYVAFDSDATNFVAGLDVTRRVWRKDVTTGEIQLVAIGSNPSISWDGRYVAFEAAGQVQVKDMTTGSLRMIAQGSAPRLSARADRIAFVSAAKVMHVDLGTGTVRTVGSGDQPAMSADGRFVAWRGQGTNGFTQISVQDVDRGVTALVTQTAAGAGGNGDSLYPSVSGDGAQVAFVSNARDLVNGTPTGTQAYLAANPLPLPEKTGYWYLAAANGGQGWLLERWGNQAYVGGLVYDAAGRASWVSGYCQLSGLVCSGTLSVRTGGAAFGAATGPVPVAGQTVGLTLTTSADGRSTSLQVGNAAAQTLSMFPIAGTATTGFSGLPQAGWWIETGSTGGNGYFVAVDTQPQPDGSVKQMAYVTVLTFDGAGRPAWYVAQAALGADLGFSGTLLQYAGGAQLGQVQAGTAGSAPVGPLRITFTGNETGRINLPNGRTADISRFRF